MVGLKGVPFPAGIENFTEQVGCRLVERGHEVTVYVRPYVRVGDHYRGMRTKRLPSINTKHLDALSHTFLATLAAAFSGADIVHYHALGPSVFSGIPRLRGLKTIAHVHGLDWQRAKWANLAKRCLRGAEYGAARFPDRTVAISRALKQYFEAKYHRAVDYVPTGVASPVVRLPDAIRHWGLGEENYVLFLSRLVPEKGCHHLIEAFRGLNTRMKLVVAGPESHSAAYARTLREMSTPDVLFTGAVSGALLEELYSNAYLYVLPSEVEGLPHALLQAMSFGKCVLASDIEANVEAMGGHGVTFPCGDAIRLREELDRLLKDPALVRERARGASAHVDENYSWEVVVDRLESVYRSLLRDPRKQRAKEPGIEPMPAASPTPRSRR